MQDRDMLLYVFFNNKLKEENSVEIYCKSYDDNNELLNYNAVKQDEDVFRMNMKLGYIRLTYYSDMRKTVVEGYLDVDAKLKELDETFMELIIKQFIEKMFISLDKERNLKKISRHTHHSFAKEFYDFYDTEIYKMIYGDDYEFVMKNI